MSEEKFRLYNEIINEMLSEAISCTPENWTQGVLIIACDGKRIDYSLKNPHEEGRADISDKLRLLCEKTYVAFAQSGDVWIEAYFAFSQNETGAWDLNVEFSYPESDED